MIKYIYYKTKYGGMIMYIKINKISYKIVGCFIILFCVFVFLITVYYDFPKKIVSVSNNKLKPIYSVDIQEKKVAISFDACWGKERTDKILDILDKYNVKTTFFLVNIWIEDYPEKANKIVERGHEIGLHSSTHTKFTELSDEKIREELENNKEMIKQVTNYNGILFRPPFGDYNTRVINIIQEMDLYPIQWSVDSLHTKLNSLKALVYHS
jgi:peptidoglycan/xylan/chitin deacetylase (PgdA/CDA1 family)